MQIIGEWFICTDSVARPTLLVKVAGAVGVSVTERFLLDIGADATVFSASLIGNLNLPTQPTPAKLSIQGIGGTSPGVVVATQLELPRYDGGPATVGGTFAAFTDPAASDLSILGRNVLDQFDVILSRRRNEVLLLAGNHQYQITS
jgi:hypothetical protein